MRSREIERGSVMSEEVQFTILTVNIAKRAQDDAVDAASGSNCCRSAFSTYHGFSARRQVRDNTAMS